MWFGFRGKTLAWNSGVGISKVDRSIQILNCT